MERLAEIPLLGWVLIVIVLIPSVISIIYQSSPRFREWVKNLSPEMIPITRGQFKAFQKEWEERVRGFEEEYQAKLRAALDEALDDDFGEDRREDFNEAAAGLVDRSIAELREQPTEAMRRWARQTAERLMLKAAEQTPPDCKAAVSQRLVEETGDCVSEHLGRKGRKRSPAGKAFFDAIGAEMTSADAVGSAEVKQATLSALLAALPEVVQLLLLAPRKERSEHIHAVLDSLGGILARHCRELPDSDVRILLDAFSAALQKAVREEPVRDEMEKRARETSVAFARLENLPEAQRNQVETMLADGVVVVYQDVLTTDQVEILERRREIAVETLADWTRSLRELRPELVESQIDVALVDQMVGIVREPETDPDLWEAQTETLIDWTRNIRVLRPDQVEKKVDPPLVTLLANRVRAADGDRELLERLQPVQATVIVEVASALPGSKANLGPLQNALVKSCAARVAEVRWDRKHGWFDLAGKLDRAFGSVIVGQVEDLPSTAGETLAETLEEPLVELAADRLLQAVHDPKDGLWRRLDPTLQVKLGRCAQALTEELVMPVAQPAFLERAAEMAASEPGGSYDLLLDALANRMQQVPAASHDGNGSAARSR